jgi:hypothetical protein
VWYIPRQSLSPQFGVSILFSFPPEAFISAQTVAGFLLLDMQILSAEFVLGLEGKRSL